MRLSRSEFLHWKHKAVTLLGMSGTGKTTLANKLPKHDWFHYSGDYRIGTKYLQEPILDNIKRKAMQVDFLRDLLRNDAIYIASNLTVHNLDSLSSFLGKVGNPALEGLSLTEFQRRQRLHHDAEVGAMHDVADFISKGQEIYGYAHFINDAGGSLCELEDDHTIEFLAGHTLILYLQAGEEMEQTLIERQISCPKPLYYQQPFFDQKLQEFMALHRLGDVCEMEPDSFVRWIFPKLVAHRRPLYEKYATRFGYTVAAEDAESVRDEQDFLHLVSSAIDNAPEAAA